MDKNSTEAVVATQNAQNNTNRQGTGNIKEAVCIDAARVYDSCSSQQCAGCIPEIHGAAPGSKIRALLRFILEHKFFSGL
ncbi:hypothetical protein CAFE_23000 [Caprobacter fermentans]|uniref:Uncharacterized protein n=2 Tax=Caproicibacter fermentans TaxID=2576756 RepID=A0A6N8I1F9_9FIRM|nr:hypothetical protein [Caproicibacter fermentans]OCN02151.1 hypothetical protein A7X67_12085 [Clostridium sp. W14A]